MIAATTLRAGQRLLEKDRLWAGQGMHLLPWSVMTHCSPSIPCNCLIRGDSSICHGKEAVAPTALVVGLVKCPQRHTQPTCEVKAVRFSGRAFRVPTGVHLLAAGSVAPGLWGTWKARHKPGTEQRLQPVGEGCSQTRAFPCRAASPQLSSLQSPYTLSQRKPHFSCVIACGMKSSERTLLIHHP